MRCRGVIVRVGGGIAEVEEGEVGDRSLRAAGDGRPRPGPGHPEVGGLWVTRATLERERVGRSTERLPRRADRRPKGVRRLRKVQ